MTPPEAQPVTSIAHERARVDLEAITRTLHRSTGDLSDQMSKAQPDAENAEHLYRTIRRQIRYFENYYDQWRRARATTNVPQLRVDA